MPKYLTAVNGTKGNLEWQLHHDELPKDGNSKTKVQFAFVKKLSPEEERFSLDELIPRYATDAAQA